MSSTSSFTISERKFFLRLFDVLFVFGGIIIGASFSNFYYFNLSSSMIVTWFLTLGFYLVLFSQIFEMYSLSNSDDYFKTIRNVVGTALAMTFFYIFTPFVSPVLPANRLQIIYLFLAIFVPLVLWRIFYIVFVFSPKYFKTILLIGNHKDLNNLIDFIIKKAPTNQITACISDKDLDAETIQYYNFRGEKIETVIEEHSISEVIVSNYDTENQGHIHSQLVHLFEKGTSIISEKKFKEREAALMPEMQFKDAFYDVMTLSPNHQNRFYLVFMRLFDIVISLVGLVFLALISPFVFIGNLLTSRGALFYNQTRVGLNGTNFEIIKFRTMIMNAEKNGAVWAKKNDRRVTRFGKFLRKTRLDEVPQFWNILKGEMALIGPRPERPEFVKDLEKELPFYSIRHIIRPGLTGWAQVRHPYAANMEDQEIKMRYDLYYIKERNSFMDFKIIVNTISTVLFFRGQ